MSKIKTRGISLVIPVREWPEPNRKESVLVKHEFRVRCNAAIPLDHKNFQNQFLSEDYVAPKLPPLPKKDKKKGGKGNISESKLQKHKNNYLV
jgi:hypothetical protein